MENGKTQNRKIKAWQFILLLLLIVGTFFILRKSSQQQFYENEGLIFGTTYHIKYESSQDLRDSIAAELQKVDSSLSIFNNNSVISKINNNENVTADNYFTQVFVLADSISKETNGAFDITVAPLVNAWGFGFKNAEKITQKSIDSLRSFVGFDKVALRNGHILKQDKHTMLDCGAIAKGFGVDCVANMLRRHGVKNLMVEIGGEVVASGVNEQKEAWKIGISKPVDGEQPNAEEIQTVIDLKDCAMATSGNYRNFYYKDGKKYAHTIDPHTGRPVQHNILSSTVIAPTCAKADGFATSFMVLGLEKAKAVLTKHKELKAYFIYADANGKLKVWKSF